MGLYTKGVYPELSYKERADDVLSARTYDALKHLEIVILLKHNTKIQY
mgnify:CR=1 FL=1